MRFLKITCFWYVDDALIIGISFVATIIAVLTTLKILKFFNLKVNIKKSMLLPARSAAYIGVIFNLDKWSVSIMNKTIVKARKFYEELMVKTT